MGVARGGWFGGVGLVAGCTWLLRGEPLAQNRKEPSSLFHAKKSLLCDPKVPVKRRIHAFYSTCVAAALHGAGEWAYTQSMFQALRVWELGKLRRVLWLRRRTDETGSGPHETDRTCCGKAAEEARPASFSNACDVACSAGCMCTWHTLLMALGNADTGKKLLHGAVTTSGGRPTSNFTKDGPKRNTKWKRPLTGRQTCWERPFTRLLGDAWLPKVKACKSWTEWRSLTKELERVWHAMLSLKPPELTTATCDVPQETWTVCWCLGEHRRLVFCGDS